MIHVDIGNVASRHSAGTFLKTKVHTLKELYRRMWHEGDPNFNVLAIILIAIPLIIFAVSNISRHLSGQHGLSTDKKLMEVGNCKFSILYLSFFLFTACTTAADLALELSVVFLRIHH